MPISEGGERINVLVDDPNGTSLALVLDFASALADPDSALTKAFTGDDGWPSEIG